MAAESRYGWESDFREFERAPARSIRGRLEELVREASDEQIRAWDESIPPLQREIREVIEVDVGAERFHAILEYELPLDSRRPDVIFLLRGAVVVIELKGKERPSQADLDQASAYARDLRCYHRSCEHRPVHAAVVPTRASGMLGEQGSVHVVGPDALDALLVRLDRAPGEEALSPRGFLDEEAYRPLPTLVEAARQLFRSNDLVRIHRARTATAPALSLLHEVVKEAARERQRHLVLLTGLPGAGKTLVGLQLVHAGFLDDLAIARESGKPTVPAVFLTGNGPLCEVLQYEFKAAGGGGRTFVRGVKDYLKRYARSPSLVPQEHVLVFDEAQRAFDAEQVAAKHDPRDGVVPGRSEPEHFIEFSERVPEWCVVLGLIGTGQEIHVGEEAGIGQWREAIGRSASSESWTIHAPPHLAADVARDGIRFRPHAELHLDREIRFHVASDVHALVDRILSAAPAAANATVAARLEEVGYHLRITRSVEVAKRYLRERYSEHRTARFGIVASSRDKDLVRFGIDNDYQATKRVRYGPWYADEENASGGRSCRRLVDCVTEFGAQGLELDAALLAWGTDLMLVEGRWSDERARRYKRGTRVRDPFQLRRNAYRVLLTRGRDGTIVFVPPLTELDATHAYLIASGYRTLDL